MKKIFLSLILLFSIAVLHFNCISPDTAQKKGADGYVAATSILSSVSGYYRSIEMDGQALYSLSSRLSDRSTTNPYITVIDRIDKMTGETQKLKINSLEHMYCLALDGDYVYLYGGREVYRTFKSGGGSPEKIAEFGNNINQLKVDGNKMYISFNWTPGLFLYNIPDGTMTTLVDSLVGWLDVDEKYLFWRTWQSENTAIRTIWQKSRDTGTPVARVTGELGDVRIIGDYIYYWEDNDPGAYNGPDVLKKISKLGNEEPVIVISNPEHFTEDDGFVITGDMLYASNFDGELWGIPLKDPKNAVLLDKWGSYDDDDFRSWIATDGNALYWVAGPNVNERISDDDEGALLKTDFISR